MPEAQRRFYAIGLFERDDKIGAQMTMVPDVEASQRAWEEAMDDDAEKYHHKMSAIPTLHPLLAGVIQKRAEEKMSVPIKLTISSPTVSDSAYSGGGQVGCLLCFQLPQWEPGPLTGLTTECLGRLESVWLGSAGHTCCCGGISPAAVNCADWLQPDIR